MHNERLSRVNNTFIIDHVPQCIFVFHVIVTVAGLSSKVLATFVQFGCATALSTFCVIASTR